MIFCLSAHAFAGDQVGNGAGLAEQRFMLATKQLPAFGKFLLASRSPLLSAKDRDLLESIINSYDEELAKNPSIISFKSGKKHPGFFTINGQEKVAKTTTSLGDTIFINKDLIYENNQGKIEAMALNEIIGILFHEFAHHQGIIDEEYLEHFGAITSALIHPSFDRNTDYVTGFTINSFVLPFNGSSTDNPTKTIVWIEDAQAILNLSTMIEDKLPCKNPNKTYSRSAHISNFYWIEPYSLGGEIKFVLKGKMNFGYCIPTSGRAEFIDKLELVVNLPVRWGTNQAPSLDMNNSPIVTLRPLKIVREEIN